MVEDGRVDNEGTLQDIFISVSLQPVSCEHLTEHEEDAGQHPGLDSRQTLRLGGVGGHVVEDVHENQEQGHQQCHTPWYKSLLLTLMTRLLISVDKTNRDVDDV